MAAPELVPATPVRERPGLPAGRVVLPPGPDGQVLAFFEWELTGQAWSDEHPHDEYAYVLAGELHVTVDGTTVVAGPGALVRVPAGSRGTYAAPVHARVLGVYGPRPALPEGGAAPDAHGVLTGLTDPTGPPSDDPAGDGP